MSEYDEKVPKALMERQEWFASIITRPMKRNSKMNLTSPTGAPMEEEAEKYILPSPTLQPHQRIELYNQQYWWRLLNTLHENFPLTLRLFGYRQFNKKIAIPYLTKFPPNHWSLNLLGERLPEWAESDYRGADSALVQEALEIDWAYIKGFFAAEHPLAEGLQAESPLLLQPHLTLLSLTHKLPPLRDEIVEVDPKEVDREVFEKLEKKRYNYYVIFRNNFYNVSWKEIDDAEFQLLSLFENGISISEACQWIEESEPRIRQEAEKNLHLWFQEWSARSWLARVCDTANSG